MITLRMRVRGVGGRVQEVQCSLPCLTILVKSPAVMLWKERTILSGCPPASTHPHTQTHTCTHICTHMHKHTEREISKTEKTMVVPR